MPSAQVNSGIPRLDSKNPLDVIEHRKPVRQHIWEFGCIFSIIFLAIGAYQSQTRSIVQPALISLAASGGLLSLAKFAPSLLLPVWKGWMKFAMFLGTYMTLLIVSIAWTIVVIPTGLLLRLLGKSVMDMKYGVATESYWEDREDKMNDFQLLERQF